MWAVVGATMPFLSSFFQFFVYKSIFINLFNRIYSSLCIPITLRYQNGQSML